MTARANDSGGGQSNDGKPLDFSADIVHQILDLHRDSRLSSGGILPGIIKASLDNEPDFMRDHKIFNCFPINEDIWTKLNNRTKPGDDTSKPPQTVTMKNGDEITIGGPGRFTIVDKNGRPVERDSDPRQIAMDAPLVYKLTNGAEYVTRGGWNHDEFIRYPNGDYVHFTDGGKLVSSQINGKEKQYG